MEIRAPALASKTNVIKVDKEVPLELLGPLGCGIQTGSRCPSLRLLNPSF